MHNSLRYTLLAIAIAGFTSSFAASVKGIQPAPCPNGTVGSVFSIYNGLSNLLSIKPSVDSGSDFSNIGSGLNPNDTAYATYCGKPGSGQMSSLETTSRNSFGNVGCDFGFKMDKDGNMSISVKKQNGSTWQPTCHADNNMAIRIGS